MHVSSSPAAVAFVSCTDWLSVNRGAEYGPNVAQATYGSRLLASGAGLKIEPTLR